MQTSMIDVLSTSFFTSDPLFGIDASSRSSVDRVPMACCAVAACLKSKRTTLAEKPLDVVATLDEESKESPDELSESRHAKPVATVEAVPEDTRVRAVSFDIEQPVVSPLQESRANSSKWSLVKPST